MDTLSDLLIRIKNGYMARKKMVLIPHSKMNEAITVVLEKNNYIEKYQVKTTEKGFKDLEIMLKYDGSEPVLTDIKRVSKPGLRIYSRTNKLPRVLSGLGIAIVSTSQGLMTDKEARKKGVGGELIARVW
ncbi:MAG: 30S ribosomal protein S8 [Candidatus Woykebacteria bacterium RIFCSPHIGHO2_12_FULL_43_10]|uniref:Small ribosomal subunit protein uS8 n=2 Tax=Candidatus Woykeibacteriota TaxID=1817899 RepID=A0A1G1WXG6_9BACT|nr:MAG: 30S ribosomal protein S8 [Candidatus Woykebacteria bacterium RIFCSPHIGHO2_01_FULL_43_29]OGY28709.1 MAG: 30S ribosomal protein S8 [Candidatus Woykebacteria bacterium RIFCSPHIGHO2_02_FULL_43_16b]OGY29784.1 MAG: 30S ribosomal protein S8 [Candidatus Woykebacteria bacterium RIFCSPHIGHO2_12_FULL_43_10]OGY32458.1 MAG: 30S ribosomal protein S8 [Candidatus Woykebacteria bacterium RIFCSPLOWO2_01_FULL_43_14]